MCLPQLKWSLCCIETFSRNSKKVFKAILFNALYKQNEADEDRSAILESV